MMLLQINKITSHIPALQVVIPMLGIFCSVIFRKAYIAYRIAIFTSFINVVFNILIINHLIDHNLLSYAFGGWQAPIGIIFKLDYLNFPVIFLINLIFFLFFSFGNKLLQEQVLSITDERKAWIVYALLLLLQIGLLGISCTGDLFNLYVFIEISSLAAYALISLGKDKRAVVGAFNYLILGTIGATFILIGVGLILYTTGSLNMDDVKQLSANLYSNKAFLLGIAFFLTGSLLKVALIPFHAWMVQAYEFAATIIISAIAGISNFVGFYIVIKFIYTILDYKILYNQFNIGLIFEGIGVLSILIGSLLATFQNSFKKILIYSSLTHIGYATLLLSFSSENALSTIMLYLITDVMLKTALFIGCTILESLKGSSDITSIKGIIRVYPRFTWLLGLNIINNAALPPTMHFFNKLSLVQLFINNGHIFSFIAILIASLLGLIYNYNIINSIFFEDSKKLINPFKAKPIEKSAKFLFYLLSTMSITMVLFYGILQNYTTLITKTIF